MCNSTAQGDGHSAQVMLSTYAAWTRTEADIARIKRAMESHYRSRSTRLRATMGLVLWRPEICHWRVAGVAKVGEKSHKGLAERTGLEPATPGVTGRYSNQLNYRSALEPL